VICTDQQVRRLMKLAEDGLSLAALAAKAGMGEKTARKYLKAGKLPSQLKQPREWRTRVDPFAVVWPEVEEQLREAPELEALTLFEELERRYPGRFQPGQLRTLQRRVRVWRGLYGPEGEIFFPQVHRPGVQCQSDFTSMNELGVTIGGLRFPHLVYHFVLVYSNWEYGEICFSESYQALSTGLQNALGKLGRVPEEHRTDNLTAATFRGRSGREFNEAYLGLVGHYGMRASKNHPGQSHQNGDVEQSHYRIKERLDQALLLRGSRDFAQRGEYEQFLGQVFDRKNQTRQRRWAEEVAVMRPLPERRLEDWREYKVRVTSWSTVTVAHNTYSVPARLSRYEVVARLHADRVEIRLAGHCVAEMERLRGKGKVRLNYRHVIGALLRKPGAFERYRFREELFPSTVFRQAYDRLLEADRAEASRRYLQILHWAAEHSESAMEQALREFLGEGRPLELAALVQQAESPLPRPVEVDIPPPDLGRYDALLGEVAP
jgi:transposase